MKSAITTRTVSMPAVIAASVLALICAASNSRALAAEPDQYLTKMVPYGDLNLDAEAGAKAFYVRLRYAAKYVCSPLEAKELSRHRIWQSCVDQALASAVRRIDKPLVTALHNQSVTISSAG
jgi:UrcA family protein